MGTEIIKWGGGHKLSSPRPEAVLGRGKIELIHSQGYNKVIPVFLCIWKLSQSKGLKGALSFQLGCFSDISLGNGCSSVQVLFHLLAHWILKTSSKSWQMRRLQHGCVRKVLQPERAKGCWTPALPSLASFLSLQRSPCDGWRHRAIFQTNPKHRLKTEGTKTRIINVSSRVHQPGNLISRQFPEVLSSGRSYAVQGAHGPASKRIKCLRRNLTKDMHNCTLKTTEHHWKNERNETPKESKDILVHGSEDWEDHTLLKLSTDIPCFIVPHLIALGRYSLFFYKQDLCNPYIKQVYQRHFSNDICSLHFCVTFW